MPQIKTKIIATLGPSTQSVDVLVRMLNAGITAARINFSYGTPAHRLHMLSLLREAIKQSGKDCVSIADLQGRKIRLGKVFKGMFSLQRNENVILIPAKESRQEKVLPVDAPDFLNWVDEETELVLKDGQIRLKVVKKYKGQKVEARVLHGGDVVSHAGVKIYGKKVRLEAFTEKDKEDLVFAVKNGVDVVLQSFVESARDIRRVRAFLKEQNLPPIPIFAKIEKREAVGNLGEIIAEADGIVIARGDLGLELPLEQIPLLQKAIIRKCREEGKPVITATQMLESMIMDPQPTRAEISDVANAILDGTDALLLSAETAVGKYPVEAVQTLVEIAREIEENLPFQQPVVSEKETITAALSQSVVSLAEQVKASLIIAPTSSGYTARMISRFRPKIPIYACSPFPPVRKYLSLCWGVFPLPIPHTPRTDETMEQALYVVGKEGRARPGDVVILTAGVPSGISGTTNLIKVHIFQEILARGQPTGSGCLTGTIGKEILFLPTPPEHWTAPCYLIESRSQSARRKAERTGKRAIFSLKILQPLREGDKVTVDFSEGIVYRACL
ncbi:MAG: pyruvate kinase [bacterium JZ-2024 1]